MLDIKLMEKQELKEIINIYSECLEVLEKNDGSPDTIKEFQDIIKMSRDEVKVIDQMKDFIKL